MYIVYLKGYEVSKSRDFFGKRQNDILIDEAIHAECLMSMIRFL